MPILPEASAALFLTNGNVPHGRLDVGNTDNNGPSHENHPQDSRRHAFVEKCTTGLITQVSIDLDGGPLDALPNDARFVNSPEQVTSHHVDQSAASQTICIWTGIGSFDRMLHAFAKHAGWSARIRTMSHPAVDHHRTIEETSFALGSALAAALGDSRVLARYGFSFAPFDEALCRAVVELSGSPFFVGKFDFKGESIGDMTSQMVWLALNSFSQKGGINLHVDVLRGNNDHHRSEAAFKAVALAVKMACASVPYLPGGMVSTGDDL